ncbi:MAG: sensor histidine kinase [Ignavibacteria bacterium]
MFLGLSLAFLSLGVWIGSNSQCLQLYFPSPYFYYFLDNISFFSLIFGPFYITEQIIDVKFKKIVRWLWKVNLLYIIISMVIEFLPGYNFAMIFPYYLIILFIMCFVGMFVMILSASNGNFQTRLIVFGFVICSIFALLELLIFSDSSGAYSPVLVHLGSFTLVIILSLTLFYEFKTTRNQKDLAQKKALEAINKEKETRKRFTQKLINAQENERKRISFELHDAVGQDLLVIKNMTRLIQKNKNDLDVVEDFLNDISEAAENSIKDIRDISRTLHPYQLNKLGLTAALKSLITKVENSTEVYITSEINNVDKAFDQSKEIHIFRVLQECLNNIIKHSKAKNVNVEIIKNDSGLLLKVKDDGCGFEIEDNKNSSNHGMGITGINERVQILNGTLDIQPQLNIGTCIKVFIPIIKNETDQTITSSD